MFYNFVFLWFGITLTIAEEPANIWDVDDGMGVTDKEKVEKIALELLKDAKLKARQITDIVNDHSVVVQFQVGYILGQIREKYKHMLEIYRETKDWYNNKTTIPGPGFRKFLPLHYFIRMEKIHSKEVDIDKMVHVLELIPQKQLEAVNSLMIKNNTKAGNHSLLLLRSRDDSASIALQRQEEELKSKYREQYAMKKLGIKDSDDLLFIP